MLTASSADKEYNSGMIGNGEIMTMVGPTGYHNGRCPPEEKVNRTIFWAGRRLKDARSANIRIPRVSQEELIGPTLPLVRFGRLSRTLEVNGQATKDDEWEQTFDPDGGRFLSVLDHSHIEERTESLACLTKNTLIFHTTLSSTDSETVRLKFILEYDFGDSNGEKAEGTRLYIRRPHPDDLEFGNVEGTRSAEMNIDGRPPHLRESLSIQYEIEKHLGEVRIGRWPNGVIQQSGSGGRFIHELSLAEGVCCDLWFWVNLGDRTTYNHYPEYEQVLELVEDHRKAWKDFWERSRFSVENADLEGIRKACLYTLRCNSSPWTCPPGYLSTHWEGRSFHDEFYPFMGFITSGYTELAEKIPNFRMQILPLALKRGAGRGAYYGWEVTETGEESAPYGHWTDEQFRHGQFSEQAWRYYLHTGDQEILQRYYPVIRGCAEWMAADLLMRDASGKLVVRTVSDITEHVVSARNPIFAASATIRALENAARSAEILDKDPMLRKHWQTLADELQSNLPRDEDGTYRYADDSDVPPETAHLGMVFPFSFGLTGISCRDTFLKVWNVYQNSQDPTSSDLVLDYNWIWTIGRLATICFYLGRADQGYQVLKRAAACLGPFYAPNEHYRREGGAFLPWFATGAGSFVTALNAMFVQVYDENGAVLLPAVPGELQDAEFHNLAATQGVLVSGEIRAGKIVTITAHVERKLDWIFRIPSKIAKTLSFAAKCRKGETDDRGFLKISCALEPGDTPLLA